MDADYSRRAEAAQDAAIERLGYGYRIGNVLVTFDSRTETGVIYVFGACWQCGAHSVMRSDGSERSARGLACSITHAHCGHQDYQEFLRLPVRRLTSTTPRVYVLYKFDSCIHVAVKGARSERSAGALARNLARRYYGHDVGHYVSSGSGPYGDVYVFSNRVD